MLTYKHVGRQEDAARGRPATLPVPLPPPSSSSFLCSQSMLSYLATTDVSLLGEHQQHHHHHRRPSDANAETDRVRSPVVSIDSADPTLFPWRPASDSDLRHYNSSIFQQQQQPLSLSDYSPSATRLYPSSYFGPPPPTGTGNFFPFPPPPPTSLQPPPRHYLQIESYSAILASMGGGQGPHPPPPARPTPIFSVSNSNSSGQSQFGLLAPPPPPPPPHVVHFSPPPPPPALYVNTTTTAPTATTSPNSSSSSSSTATDDVVVSTPCQSPSCRAGGSYPQGSLKHRILVRPESKEDPAELLVTGKRNRRPSPSSPPKCSPTPVLTRTLLSGGGTTTVPLKSTSEVKGDVQPGRQDIQQQQHLRYPAHFMKGSVIQLANGELRCVEDLRTEDFVSSAELSADLRIDSSTVVRIDEHPDKCESPSTAALTFLVGDQRIQVTVEASSEHPFFVFGRGWSSCCPERTMKRYALQCHRLQVGDVCISLTHRHGRQPQPQQHVVRPLPVVDEPDRIRPSLFSRKPSGGLPFAARMRRKRRWSASDAMMTVDATAAVSTSEHIRSVSLADASDGSAT